MADHGILIATAARPHPTETINGDAWHVDWHTDGCRIAVIDGLGHGPEAAAAASRAREVLTASPDANPVDALRLCHEALRATRGAAIGIATIAPPVMRVTYAGVGNVEARLITSGRTLRLPSSRGIVGAVLPTIRPIEATLEPEWLLLIHSDGVSERIDLSGISDVHVADLQSLADSVLTRWGRTADDATVVLARPSSGDTRKSA
jgi:serine phosphatase RsbU (regulator of sigma subunit)